VIRPQWISLILFVVLFAPAVRAQSPGSKDTCTASCAGTRTWYIVGGAAVATGVLIHYDERTYLGIHGWKERSRFLQDVSPVVTNGGDGTFSAVLFTGITGYGLIFKNTRAVEMGKLGIESFLFTGISVQILKQLFGRERPSAATRPGGFWHGPFSYFRDNHRQRGIAAFDAFPSGHTTTAFAAATTIADCSSEAWVSYACYSLAGIVAISRVMERTHWLSDCLAGALLGHYGTKLVERWNGSSSSMSVVPRLDERGGGISLTMNF